MWMYVSEICAEGIFVTFPWWLKTVKSRSKIALFSNERHFETWFPKKRTVTFFWSKLSKLHKKDPILHVATTFSLKQRETRASHGPIPHPLKELHSFISNRKLSIWFDRFLVILWIFLCFSWVKFCPKIIVWKMLSFQQLNPLNYFTDQKTVK